MKIIVPRNITSLLSTPQNETARRRFGLSTFLKHLAICFVLGVVTLLFADGGGLIFLAGAIATAAALGLLIKRILELGVKLSYRLGA